EDAVEIAGVVARREVDLRRQTPHRECTLKAEPQANRIAALGPPDDDVHDLRRPLGELGHRGEDWRIAGGEGGLGHGNAGKSIGRMKIYYKECIVSSKFIRSIGIVFG